MHAIEGRLSEGALANLVQFLAMNQASGCLQLLREGVPGGQPQRGAVYLVAGRVEHVETAALEGVPALSALLAWPDGRFAFAAGVHAPRRSLDLSVDALLLHASVGRDTAASRNGAAVPAHAAAPRNGAANGTSNGMADAYGASPRAAAPAWADAGVGANGRGAQRSGGRLADALASQSAALPLFSGASAVLAPAPLAATPLVDPTLVPGLVWAAVAVVGPIGEIFVQEAFDTIGHTPRLLPECALGALVLEVAGRFRSSEGRAQFVARAEAVLAHHGYGRVEESP